MTIGPRGAHTVVVGTALLVLAVVLGIAGALGLRRRAGTGFVAAALPRADVGGDDLTDLADLDAAFDRVCAAHAHEMGILLGARLTQLVDRQVPVRAIRQAPGERTVRVCFADGTVLLARGHVPGDLGKLAWALHAHSVQLAGYSRDERGTNLDFRWRPDHRLAALAVGLDQPD